MLILLVIPFFQDLLKKVIDKGKMTGALALVISLTIESSPLALLFLASLYR